MVLGGETLTPWSPHDLVQEDPEIDEKKSLIRFDRMALSKATTTHQKITNCCSHIHPIHTHKNTKSHRTSSSTNKTMSYLHKIAFCSVFFFFLIAQSHGKSIFYKVRILILWINVVMHWAWHQIPTCLICTHP